MFGQSLLSGALSSVTPCTTDTDQLFTSDVTATSTATYQLNSGGTSIPSNTYPLTTRGITYAAGKFGNAAGFSGSTASTGSQLYVSNSIYGGNTSIFSVSLWVKCTNTSGDIPLSGNGGTIGGTAGYALYLESGKLTLTFRSSSGGQDFYGSTTYINDNAWHHIVLTFNNGPYAVYLDGSVSFSGTTGNFLNNTTPTFDTYFGNRWNRNENGVLAGQMDQIRVFGTTVLNQAAVTVLYNETVATSSSASINYQLANPNSVAYYKMSDASDQLGINNGTATNVNFNTEGKFGFAGAFNGSSSTISTPITTNYSNTSISCWVNFNSLPTGGADATLVSKGFYTSGSNTQYIHLRYEDSQNQFTFAVRQNGTYNQQAKSGVTASVGVWYHVVGILDSSGNAQIYVNGTAGTGITSAPTMTNSNDFEIGTFVSNSAFLNDKIDQIRIYNSVLSAANVTTLYEEIECPAATIVNSFNPVIYSGTGGTQSISTVGFKPDLVWIKQRTAPNRDHILFDSVRGPLPNPNILYSNLGNTQDTGAAEYLSTFNNNGFTVGNSNYTGASGEDYVSWSWKAGGAAVANNDGNVTSQVSVNDTSGFSIVDYTAAGGTPIGHGLTVGGKSVAPDLIILKGVSAAEDWLIYNSISGTGNYLSFSKNGGVDPVTARAQSFSSVTAKTFTDRWTGGSVNWIAYCFASIPGYSRVGSYNGTGASGNTIYIGFEPSFLIIKSTGTESWYIMDNKRLNGIYSDQLYANLPNSEGAGQHVDFITDGFKLDTTDGGVNNGSAKYIFLAIAK